MKPTLHLPLHPDKPFDVIAFGLNSVDYLCVVPEYPEYNTKKKMTAFSRQGGGQAATAMVACSRWGLRTKYMGKCGADEQGRLSLELIASEGVDVSDVIVADSGSNQFAFIMVDAANGERTIVWNRGPELAIDPSELGPEPFGAARVLLLDGHEVPASIQAARWAREAGVPVVLDAERVKDGTDELVALTDVLLASSEFPGLYTGCSDDREALEAIGRLGPSFVGMTLGREGSLARHRGRWFRTPGYAVESVDTTGAGDIFHAGFVYGMLQGWPVEKILRYANGAAALSCRALGGRAGIAGVAEVQALIEGGAGKRPAGDL